METVVIIVIALLLVFGPVAGFFLGMKFSAGLFGIDLHPGDTLRTVDWKARDLEDLDDLPEIYRPHPAEGDADEDAEATLEPDPADQPDSTDRTAPPEWASKMSVALADMVEPIEKINKAFAENLAAAAAAIAGADCVKAQERPATDAEGSATATVTATVEVETTAEGIGKVPAAEAAEALASAMEAARVPRPEE